MKRKFLVLAARYRRWRGAKHHCRWDRSGTDTLAVMIEADRLRKARQLP